MVGPEDYQNKRINVSQGIFRLLQVGIRIIADPIQQFLSPSRSHVFGHCPEKGMVICENVVALWWYGARVGGPIYYAINLILRLFFYRFLHTLSSESIHNNTNTQQTSPPWWWSRLPLQRRGFDDSMPPEGRVALHMYCPRPLLKDLNRFIKLK